MQRSQVGCYLLCGNEAERSEGYKLDSNPGVGPNIRIVCPECGEYVLTDFAQRFYFFPQGDQEVIDDADKKRLAEYVKNNQNPEKPVMLSSEVVKRVTGKESVHIRYS